MPRQIDLKDSEQLPPQLRLEGCLVDPETGDEFECWMDFIRESGNHQDNQLLELARRYDCIPGSLLCVPKDDDQRPEIWVPHEFHGPDFMLTVTTRYADVPDGEERPEIRVDPFTVTGWDALRTLALTDDQAAPAAMAWVTEINALLTRVGAALEVNSEADLSTGLVAQFLCCRIADRVEVAELPTGIDYDMVTRYCAASQLRRELAQFSGSLALAGADHDHETGPLDHAIRVQAEQPPERGLAEILGHDVAARMGVDSGSRFRGMFMKDAASASAASTLSRRNDTLVRRLFAPLTRTPVEQIICGLAPPEVHETISVRLQESAEGRGGPALLDSVESHWLRQVAAECRNILADVFGGSYRPEVDMWDIDGHDIMVVKDFGGCYVYSWPSADRNVVFAPDGEVAIPMVDPSECPTAEELTQLNQQVARVYMMMAEPWPDRAVSRTVRGEVTAGKIAIPVDATVQRPAEPDPDSESLDM